MANSGFLLDTFLAKIGDLILQIISGAIGGAIVWVFQKRYTERKEKEKEDLDNLVKLKHLNKIVTDSIFNDLGPGANVELMRELLGVPTKQSNTDWPVFREEEKETHSYFYNLKNAFIKITPEDSKTINSITVFPHDSSFEVDNFILPGCIEECKLNEAVVNEDLIDVTDNYKYISTRVDSSFAIQHWVSYPLYKTFTLFGTPPSSFYNEQDRDNPRSILGGVITGLCISSSEEDAFFIYEMEAR